MTMEQKTISEFLDNDYKEFALYTVENRAIPSVIDGFKPSQRKVIHISNQIWKTGKEKNLKVFQLAGKVASDAYYHHGNTSLENAIITMAQKFKNNAPLLDEDGQFGSLRSPQAGASRYIGTKLSDNFRLIYKDFELLKYKEEEGELIEPTFFLPIIPTVLVNGSSGIAVGFSSNILNRNIIDVIDACASVIKNSKMKELVPFLPNFSGTFQVDETNNKRWIITGKADQLNTTTVVVNELPPSLTYEKYEEHLDKLVEDKLIVSYEDNSRDNINYTIKFTRKDLSEMEAPDLIKLLKLSESVTEIFTTLDEKGKLRIFESAEEIIEYFVKFRLRFYEKRKRYLLSKLDKELQMLTNRGKFISSILKGNLIVNNTPKAIIIENIEKMNLDKVDNSYDYLLKMPIYSLTKELFEKLRQEHGKKKEEIEILNNTTPEDMYIKDLRDLKRNFSE